MLGEENLESQDYVKMFRGPLIPAPDFAAMVGIFDAYAKGDVFHANSVLIHDTIDSCRFLYRGHGN